jgi:2-polyprenyl-6-methoxyphenol hydroxylase-like FAD-dependent oxidoreductase
VIELDGRTIIVGAGIGGLATALCLRNARVNDLVVLERSSDLRNVSVGGGIHIWTNGMRALSELGLANWIQEIGVPIERTRFFSTRGALLGEWPVGEIGREHGLPDIGITRADLQAMLAEAVTGTDVDVHASAECAGFEQGDGRVEVRLTGGERQSGALLVGADGLRSTVRAGLLGDGDPDYAGYTQWQTLVPDTADLLPAGEERVIFGPGLRAVMHPVGGGRLFWAGVVYGPEGRGGKSPGSKAMLQERFAGFPAPMPELIDSTPEDAVIGLDVYDRKPAKRWGEGRVTLLGDAAHPMTTNTSQGGNQALEDAVTLVRCLRERPVEKALRAYEERRRKRTAPLVKRSRGATNMNAWTDPVRLVWRDALWRLVLGRIAPALHRRDVAANP